MLPDGTYDVIVVDATADEGGKLHLEVALLDGAHKGDVVAVVASGLAVDELDALGTPGTLVVRDGGPRVTLEP